MSKRAPSLRRTMTLVVAAMAFLALVVSSSLVSLTAVLHGVTSAVGSAAEGVYLAEEAELDLFMYARTQDTITRRELASSLEQRLIDAGSYVSGAEEASTLARARTSVEAYLRADSSEARDTTQKSAVAELESLVEINLEQAREARHDARYWNDVADMVGLSVGIGVVAMLVALIMWLRRRAFAPIVELAQTMQRFERGDMSARATARGPKELSAMAERFNEMAEALRAQRETRLTFLASVAHELRNPISALALSTDMLLAPKEAPAPNELRRTLEIVHRQVVRLDRMINDLLDTARVEAGKLELQKETVDGCRLVRDVVELLAPVAIRHELRIKTPGAPIWVHGDPVRLEQVLTNLVSNAIKYSPAGGNVEVSVSHNEAEAVFEVKDQGRGLSPDEIAGLFKPFSRNPKDERVPGVGLGLAVVRGIVEAHGGYVEVHSHPGQGAAFAVHMPQA